MCKYLYTLVALILGLLTTQAYAASYHSHDDIQATVKKFLKNNLQQSKGIEITTEIGHLDPRLKLAECDTPLTAFSASDINQSSRFSVGIKCTGGKPWSLYITVNVHKMTNLYVTSRPVSRGEAISEDNIIKVSRDISKLRRSFFSEKDQLLGMIAKRSIRAGTILNNYQLKPPVIIRKGDNVDIIAKTSSLAIRMTGKALNNGAKGQNIRVKNNSSKRIIQATVITPGVVQVRL